MNSKYSDCIESPLGILFIESDDEAIISVLFTDKKEHLTKTSRIIEQCIKELQEYFSGKRNSFSVPLKFSGTDFQKKVWNQLLKIPFGKTISYQQLALQLGDIKSIRAAGTANGKNPIAIIVPCHRVIGSDGSMIGYGGGLWRKKWLLELESKNKQAQLF